MNAIEIPIQILGTQPWVERLGWTLLHSLWEGTIIVSVYAAVRAWGSRGPNDRYLLACAALTAMAIAPLATWILLQGPSPESVAIAYTAPMSAARAEPARIASLLFPSDGGNALARPFFSWAVSIWLIGATAFSLRLLGGWILAERLRSRKVRPAPGDWQRTFDRLKARVSVSRPVRFLVSGALHTPAAIGWLRPMVLMPAGALAGLPAAQIEALLVHELAHIRRHDYLVHILQSAIEAVFFYHPAVWWISSHMRAERELCCDDVTVSVTGDAVIYARALAEFASAPWMQPAVMAANNGSLAGRIARLLSQPSIGRRTPAGPGTALALILLAMVAWVAYAQSNVRAQFEVASVKPSLSRGLMNVRPLPGRLTADASLQVLVQYAYGVQPFQVVGVSGWMQSERYQIEGKADANVNRDRMFVMLQSLLEDRFQLKTHRDVKELPVFALVSNRSGVRLPPPKEGACVDSPADAATEWVGAGRMLAPGEIPPAKGRCGSAVVALGPGGAQIKGRKIAMPELVRTLSMLLGRSVVDRTGFTERFDLQLDFVPDETTPDMPPPPPGSAISGISIAQAIREQLGLRLESTKGPVEVMVVDHAERPSGN